jgi:hypothetical protein
MMQQALVAISVVLLLIGLITGFLMSLSQRTGIGKFGGSLVGGVGCVIGGIASVKVLGTLKESDLGGGVGVGLGDLLPSIIAGIVCASFLVYVVGRIGTSKRT